MKPEPRIINGFHEDSYNGNGDYTDWTECEAMQEDAAGRGVRQQFGGPDRVRNTFLSDETVRERLRELIPIVPNQVEDDE